MCFALIVRIGGDPFAASTMSPFEPTPPLPGDMSPRVRGSLRGASSEVTLWPSSILFHFIFLFWPSPSSSLSSRTDPSSLESSTGAFFLSFCSNLMSLHFLSHFRMLSLPLPLCDKGTVDSSQSAKASANSGVSVSEARSAMCAIRTMLIMSCSSWGL